MAGLRIVDLHVDLDGVEVLAGVSVSVGPDELVAVVGPSGAGKTTLLRAVAGLAPVSRGTITLADRDLDGVPTRARNLAMVSERTSLQPHRDVAGNLAFPLQLRHVAGAEVDRRVAAESRAFGLRRLLRRRPRGLSAGERRTAEVAHALVRRPDALLFDEPLAQVDAAARREHLRSLHTVQAGYGVPALLATNDQQVAAALASRIVLLQDGRVRQVGSPGELFDRPVDTTVAGFVSRPAMNLLDGRVHPTADGREVVAGDVHLDLGSAAVPTGPVTLGLHPGDLTTARDAASRNRIRGRVTRRTFTGPRVEVAVDVAAEHTILSVLPPPGPDVGEVVDLQPRVVHLFDRAGRALAHVRNDGD